MKKYNEKENQDKKEDYKKEVRDLVIARLKTIPSNASLSVGGEENLGVEELIKRVRDGDKLGEAIIEGQLDYIRSLRELPINLEEDDTPDYSSSL